MMLALLWFVPLQDDLDTLEKDARNGSFDAVYQLEKIGPPAIAALRRLDRDEQVRGHGWLWCAVRTALSRLDPERMVVHEWGTFTTVSGSDGASLEWRPLAGESDLPSFVYAIGAKKGLRHGETCKACKHHNCSCGDGCNPGSGGECGCKSCMKASVRMETPVLYFYANREATISVKVGFPKGKVTEWYPQAREVESGIDWGGVRILPGAKEEFPREKGESHYYPARETDAAPVRVCGREGNQLEKFLFYRGVGTFPLPLTVKLVEGRVRLEAAEPLTAIVFDGGRAAVHRVEKTLEIARPSGKLDAEKELLRLLVEEGRLFEKEARAMLKTWRDSWFEPGLRVFYLVPRKRVDEILPLTLDPAPAELERVLVGRVEVLTPEMERAIRDLVDRLGDSKIEVRDAATAGLQKYGRFAEPVLRRILADATDPEVRGRIEDLLD